MKFSVFILIPAPIVSVLPASANNLSRLQLYIIKRKFNFLS